MHPSRVATTLNRELWPGKSQSRWPGSTRKEQALARDTFSKLKLQLNHSIPSIAERCRLCSFFFLPRPHCSSCRPFPVRRARLRCARPPARTVRPRLLTPRRLTTCASTRTPRSCSRASPASRERMYCSSMRDVCSNQLQLPRSAGH